MKNPIIENRLNQLITRKTELLKMKKSDRGNNVKHIEKSIATLKRWIQDPVTQIPDPKPEPQRIHFPMLKNATTAMDAFAMAMESLAGKQKRKTHAEIREMIVNIENDVNGIEMNHVFIDEAMAKPANPEKYPSHRPEFNHQKELATIVDDEQRPIRPSISKNQETPGKTPKRSKSNPMWNHYGHGWREPVIENVHTVFRRMNGWD